MQGECLLKAPRPRDAGDALPSPICRHGPLTTAPATPLEFTPECRRAQINFVELVAPAPPQGSSIEKTRETLAGSDISTTKALNASHDDTSASPSAQQEPRKTKQPDHGTETKRRHSSHRCHRLAPAARLSHLPSSTIISHQPSRRASRRKRTVRQPAIPIPPSSAPTALHN